MYEKLNEYIEQKLVLLKEKALYFRKDEWIYGIKNITQAMIVKFEEVKKLNHNTQWKLENISVLHYWRGIKAWNIRFLKKH